MTTKKNTSFKGFTQATVQFFRDLAENNCKEWFDANKPVFEKEVQQPFKDLILELSPVMYNIDPQFELRPHRILSRIYRDVRFSKNKDPYKTSLWMSFQHPTKEWENLPGYFMELSADECVYGMGLYMPKKKIMDGFRENVLYDSQEFQRRTEPILNNGFEVKGDMYKRPINNSLSEYFQQWIQRKGVYVCKTIPTGKEFFGSGLSDILKQDYENLKWLYDFMKKSNGLFV